MDTQPGIAQTRPVAGADPCRDTAARGCRTPFEARTGTGRIAFAASNRAFAGGTGRHNPATGCQACRGHSARWPVDHTLPDLTRLGCSAARRAAACAAPAGPIPETARTTWISRYVASACPAQLLVLEQLVDGVREEDVAPAETDLVL